MKVSIIIPACNEEKVLPLILEEVKKLQPYEIIVIVNGSTDQTKEIAEKFGCRVINYVEPLGLNVGRAIGAKAAKGDILLFTDGDIPIAHTELLPFIQSIEEGNDLALNDLTWTLQRKIRPHPVAVAKYAMNLFCKREDLCVQALTAIPHAMKKSAAQAIGYEYLVNPPLAQMVAMLQGMSIIAPCSVDVIYTNRIRNTHKEIPSNSPFPLSTTSILGDHLEAIGYLVQQNGSRGGLTDGARDRSFLPRIQPIIPAKKNIHYSAVIPLYNEKETIEAVIKEVKKAGVEEIIVVANGADEDTINVVKKANAILLQFPDKLGHNVPRALGAMYSSGEVCLFVDADIVIVAEQLLPFLQAVDNGVDVALNDLEGLLDQVHPLHSVSAAKYLLNIATKRPGLTINTLTAIPHAMSRRVMESVGYDSLIVPPLAQVKATLEKFTVQPIQFVDVIKTNRIRKEHKKVNGLAPSTERILGDYVEAIAYLIEQTNARGDFTEKEKRMDILHQFLAGEQHGN
ncbi:glycosyltransferase family 2 protein [Bacillus sp. CGMCC 1.16541]|uniref:glycosyltransferase family 2 protein n=1 Tax=Bacillus sp. CGMCC 1.16541 TaxID=2185143 RepID=UPI000D73D250|nr:glycosyltransferase family 2 protein [Bacillus sp. CGMCC 1.16541]